MPYVERVTRAGKTIEVERYFTSRYKKPGIKRGDKVKPTKEEQKKVNTRAAERKLRLLLNANFGYGDYHLELDYIRKKGQPDRSREQMRKDMDIFLRELRKECKKAGMGFKFYRDRTTIRKSILQGIRGKVNRVKRKEKITWVDAGSLLSRLGWIWHSDTYAYYERYIKPYVKVKVLKTLVSKHARKENERNGMVRSRKHHRRETKRAGYNKQPAPCI